jgi:hypothetical protein
MCRVGASVELAASRVILSVKTVIDTISLWLTVQTTVSLVCRSMQAASDLCKVYCVLGFYVTSCIVY